MLGAPPGFGGRGGVYGFAGGVGYDMERPTVGLNGVPNAKVLEGKGKECDCVGGAESARPKKLGEAGKGVRLAEKAGLGLLSHQFHGFVYRPARNVGGL